MPTGQKVSALTVIALAVLGVIYTLAVGNEPLLGLDLQGGVSVVLEPTGTADGDLAEGAAGADQGREVTDESLDLTVELLRARIDEIGVAEPEISRQGTNIVVGLPGLVEEQEQALDRLRQTAELRFRPVLVNLGPGLGFDTSGDGEAVDGDDGSEDAPIDDGAGQGGEDGAGQGGDDGAGQGGEDGDDGSEDAPIDDGAGQGGEDGAGQGGEDGAGQGGEDGAGQGGDDGAGQGGEETEDDTEESLGASGRFARISLAQATTTTVAGPAQTDPADGDADPADGDGDPVGGESDPAGGESDPVGGESDPAGGDADPADADADGETDLTDEDTSEDGTAVTDDESGDDGAGDDGAEGGEELPLVLPDTPGIPASCLTGEVTADVDDAIDETVVLQDDLGLLYCLGPAVLGDDLLTGDMIETADVSLSPGTGWAVNPVFNPGLNGIDRFNQVASLCFGQDLSICPTGQLAIVLDHQVISAPSINAPAFARDVIVISGGSQDGFEEEEARRLAEALRFGALPLELVAQETRTVSATIGGDVLRSGVIAGLIGLALVAVYLLYYYRLAGLVAIGGLLLSAALLWTIIAWFGETFGLALSLAGVVGLIVSIGVSTDSNIVYFENVKDSFRSGRRVPTAIERAYESAISTIVKADVVSLIAAVLLFVLTVGAVRGFAFYLGLATILDLIISYMFMRPALSWLARRSAVEENYALLGLPVTEDSQ